MRNNNASLALAAMAVVALGLGVVAQQKSAPTTAAALPVVTVYKTPT